MVAESEAWEADGEGGRKSDGGSRALDFTLASWDMATFSKGGLIECFRRSDLKMDGTAMNCDKRRD